MMRLRSAVLPVLAAITLSAASACTESTNPSGNGRVVVLLTDAPFPTDSVNRVDVFVVRVEARAAAVTEGEAGANAGSSNGWQVIASPNAAYDLLTLRNGATATLGETSIAAGTYNGIRFIIDPAQSSVTLKNGTVLTGSSTPNVSFPSGNRSGIKVVLAQPLTVVAGATTTLLIDFDLDNSFVMRGNSITQNGLNFRPVIKGSIVDAATVNATVRLVNATAGALTLNQDGVPLTGASSLAFGAASSCASVNAANHLLTVTPGGSTEPIPGFTTSFTAGSRYTILGYPGLTGTQFVTLRTDTFEPATGQAGIQVFNASGIATGLDVFVTASGATLGTATVSNVATGNGSLFVSVPPGSQQIRLTSTGQTIVLLDVGTVSLTAGQNAILVIAPPDAGSVTPRAFLVPAC